jgi:spore coat protein A
MWSPEFLLHVQKLHRDLPATPLYAYGTSNETATVPGPTLLARSGVTSYVRYENHIYDKHHMLTLDYTVMWANPKNGGVPIVTHLHGAECDSTSDGYPDSWHTAFGDVGPTFSTKNYTYENSQRPSMLWYHDHTFGITRLNVLSGLSGFYNTQPPKNETVPAWLPKRKFTLPLMLQDKQFFHNGSINFPNIGDSVANHPQWCPEYFGDTILVNGKVWPYLEVRPQKYRLRFLNSANARVFVLSLSHPALSFIQIGTDGGILYKSQTLKTLTLAPAERIDTIIDFALAEGTEVILNNTGPAPYPSGEPTFSPPQTAAVLKFVVTKHKTTKPDLPVPAVLRAADVDVDLTNAFVRQLFMIEFDDADDNPTHSLLSNRTWHDPVTETPVLGATEIWEFINFTPDAHPMHIHLIEFKALNQQPFNLTAYQNGECQIFNTTLQTPGTCFTGEAIPPSANQVGWKDTILSLPEFVTRVVVQWKSYDGEPFPFDATAGPGFVWHCHILDHEDNDMMRPIKLTKKAR